MTEITHKKIGESFQLEGDMCHIDREKLKRDTGYETDYHVVSRQEGFDMFNEVSRQHGLRELRDPKGYMPLEDNVYEYIRDTYLDMYEDAYDDIDGGFGYGTKAAMRAMIDKVDVHMKKNVSEHLPEGLKYNELRFKRLTPEIADAVDDFVGKRVIITRLRSMGTLGRAVEKETFDRAIRQYHESGEVLGRTLCDLGGGELVR